MGYQRASTTGDDGFYRAVVQHGPTAVVVLDVEGRIVYANDRAEKLLAVPGPIGRGFDTLFSPSDQPRVAGYVAGLGQTTTAAGMFLTGELAPAAGEAARFVHVHGRNLLSTAEVQGLLLTLIDGTEARQREADLEHQALYDSLTGLANRTLLLERLRQVCDQPVTAGALLLVDLDDFKKVNDSLGHQVGDTLLVAVAGRLQAACPTSATIARLGGDEFAVLLPDTGVDVALKLADRACQDIAAPYPGFRLPITASIGVSEIAAVESALRQADLAMYAAKAAGRNRALAYSPAVEQSLRGISQEQQSVEALRAERDRLHTEARTDALTGLGNRRALDECLASMRGRSPVSVLFVDLDRFGAYNHRHGDLRGDQVLQQVAQTLRQTCRGTDRAFRKGGEEFVVVLPGTDASAAALAGERVRAAVEAKAIEHRGAEGVPVVTVTIGLATQPDGDLDRALRDAGDAAYAAKVEGRRNRVAACRP